MAHLNLGMALQGLGRQREAEETYRHCAQLDVSLLKDPKLHASAKITCLYNLGRLFVDEQRYQVRMNTIVPRSLPECNKRCHVTSQL